MAGLIELYVIAGNLQGQPRDAWDVLASFGLHVEFIVLVVLVILAWWKLIRERPA